jgi:hypothetical protein
VEQNLPQVLKLPALDFMAGPARAIDLKLRLALRVAALAAVCFLSVAAYALFDSDRAARAKSAISPKSSPGIFHYSRHRYTGFPCPPIESRTCKGSRRR